MRRLLAACVAAACAAALLTPAGAFASGPSLSATGGSRFPERSFLLTLSQRLRLDRNDIAVTENGGPVHALRVDGLRAARRARFGVLLAIDASPSMRGAPLRGAMSAARAFAAERQQDQPLALIAFGGEAPLAMPFTTDPYEIRSVLGRTPRVTSGTHLYDAAVAGVNQVRRAHMPGGFVVLLSDGADRASDATATHAAAVARAARVRIYTVGLHSGAFDAGPLERLASATGGKYAAASSTAELRAIYTALGSELSNAYALKYRSLEGPRRPVEVRVDVRGVGSTTASYTSPTLHAARAGPASDNSAWDSPLVRVLPALLLGALVGVGLAAALSSRRPTVRDRIAEFVAAGREGKDEEAPRGSLGERIAASVEGTVSQTVWWRSFEEDVDIADVGWSAGRLVATTAGAALALAFLLAVAGAPLIGLVVLVLSLPAMWLVVHTRTDRTRREFAGQLADYLSLVGGATRAGRSLSAAVTSVIDDASEPTRREFGRVAADVRLGAPLEDALDRLAKRMQSRDVEQVGMLAAVHRQTGSDSTEMLDRVVATIRDRQELRGTVRTLTAQGRLSRWILSLLPLVVLLLMTAINPVFMEPLYHTTTGHVLIAAGVAMVVAGSLIIKRIVSFEV